ncbi:MAG: type II toxin-antitoxin system HicB family antitoxin [Chloroflexi bacterium]|nr:type II toxin-antitoxin system HicB family antitoxin [Chloroflexota bacterium]
MLTPAEEGGYIAEVLEVPGAISQGETAGEAVAMVNDALGGIIAVMLEDGEAIPEPMGLDEYSGRFNLRISSETHRLAAMRAQLEGVSLNQWVGQAIAARLGGQTLADEVVEKLRGLLVATETTRRRAFVLEETKETVVQLPSAVPALTVLAGGEWIESPKERSASNA